MVERGQSDKEGGLAHWGVQDDRDKQASKLIGGRDKEHAGQRYRRVQFPKHKTCQDKVRTFATHWEHEGQEFDRSVSDASRNKGEDWEEFLFEELLWRLIMIILIIFLFIIGVKTHIYGYHVGLRTFESILFGIVLLNHCEAFYSFSASMGIFLFSKNSNKDFKFLLWSISNSS